MSGRKNRFRWCVELGVGRFESGVFAVFTGFSLVFIVQNSGFVGAGFERNAGMMRGANCVEELLNVEGSPVFENEENGVRPGSFDTGGVVFDGSDSGDRFIIDDPVCAEKPSGEDVVSVFDARVVPRDVIRGVSHSYVLLSSFLIPWEERRCGPV